MLSSVSGLRPVSVSSHVFLSSVSNIHANASRETCATTDRSCSFRLSSTSYSAGSQEFGPDGGVFVVEAAPESRLGEGRFFAHAAHLCTKVLRIQIDSHT